MLKALAAASWVVSWFSSLSGRTQITPSRRLARDMATSVKLNASTLERREHASIMTWVAPSLSMS